MRVFMPVKYRGMWIINGFAVIFGLFFAAISVVYFREGDMGYGIGFVMADLLLLLLCSIQFFYGLRITTKNVIAFSEGGICCIPYALVSKITVTFQPDCVTAVIRSRGKDYTAVWLHLWMFGGASLLPCLFPVRVNKGFVQKSIDKLSVCSKVMIVDQLCNSGYVRKE